MLKLTVFPLQSANGDASADPGVGGPVQTAGWVPLNSSAPMSGVVPFRVSPSKSTVTNPTGVPPLSEYVGMAGFTCRKSGSPPVVLKKLMNSVIEALSRGARRDWSPASNCSWFVPSLNSRLLALGTPA